MIRTQEEIMENLEQMTSVYDSTKDDLEDCLFHLNACRETLENYATENKVFECASYVERYIYDLIRRTRNGQQTITD